MNLKFRWNVFLLNLVFGIIIAIFSYIQIYNRNPPIIDMGAGSVTDQIAHLKIILISIFLGLILGYILAVLSLKIFYHYKEKHSSLKPNEY